MANKMVVLQLYKGLLREAGNFKSYYYRNYFVRKVRSEFRRNKDADEEKSRIFIQKAQDSMVALRRQTAIVNAYSESKLVIE